MKNILLVTSSPRGESSHSTKAANDLAEQIGGNLTVRELWREALLPIGPDFVNGIFTPEESRSHSQKAAVAPSDEAIAELKAADIVIVGAGMINFGMPAVLKTWIDLITRAGVTFKYGEAGPEGLLLGKKLILVLASGGVYSSGPAVPMDHLDSAIRLNLGFLGLTDVETVWIEGVAYGEETLAKALEHATGRLNEVAVSVR